MAYLINGVGPQVIKGLKKIRYMTIYQMEYKFMVSEEYLREYIILALGNLPQPGLKVIKKNTNGFD